MINTQLKYTVGTNNKTALIFSTNGVVDFQILPKYHSYSKGHLYLSLYLLH